MPAAAGRPDGHCILCTLLNLQLLSAPHDKNWANYYHYQYQPIVILLLSQSCAQSLLSECKFLDVHLYTCSHLRFLKYNY
jgi:hypothetical protein